MDYLDLSPVPPRNTMNVGLTAPGNAHMLALFGHPVTGGAYRPNGDCTPVDNAAFRGLLETTSIGPMRVTGLRPAVRSLEDIMRRVSTELPDLFAIVGTAGMHCARFTKIRQPDGSVRIGPGISNHSWGTAIDLTLEGELDRQGNNLTQRGLLVLSSYFNAAGWYWGAAFPVEDAMHFEASRALIARWKQAGALRM